MFRLILLMMAFIPAQSFAGHSPFHVRCKTEDDTTKLKMVQQHNKSTDAKRLDVTFFADKGGEFEAGDRIDIIIDGVVVSQLKLRNFSETKLRGRKKIKGSTTDLGIIIKKRTTGSVGGLDCVFKK